jgi:hypothetical protein
MFSTSYVRKGSLSYSQKPVNGPCPRNLAHVHNTTSRPVLIHVLSRRAELTFPN